MVSCIFSLQPHKIKPDSQLRWANEDVYRSRDQLDALYWDSRNSDQADMKTAYNEAKNNHLKLVSKTKQQSYPKKASRATSKQTWAAIKSLACTCSYLILNINNKNERNPINIGNEFCSFFIGEVDKLTAGLDDAPNFLVEENGCTGDFRLDTTEIGEVIEVLCQFGTKTSSGIDEIPCNLLKDVGKS